MPGNRYTAVLSQQQLPDRPYLLVGSAVDSVTGNTYSVFETCIESNDFIVDNIWLFGSAEQVVSSFFYGMTFSRTDGPVNCA